MKQIQDDKTIDLVDQPGVVRQRGRPATGKAMSDAERQKLRRQRLVDDGMTTLSVVIPLDVMRALDHFLQYKSETKDQLVERVLRDRLMRKR